eukprot:3890279-Rhodomonas_salina.2
MGPHNLFSSSHLQPTLSIDCTQSCCLRTTRPSHVSAEPWCQPTACCAGAYMHLARFFFCEVGSPGFSPRMFSSRMSLHSELMSDLPPLQHPPRGQCRAPHSGVLTLPTAARTSLSTRSGRAYEQSSGGHGSSLTSSFSAAFSSFFSSP